VKSACSQDFELGGQRKGAGKGGGGGGEGGGGGGGGLGGRGRPCGLKTGQCSERREGEVLMWEGDGRENMNVNQYSEKILQGGAKHQLKNKCNNGDKIRKGRRVLRGSETASVQYEFRHKK